MSRKIQIMECTLRDGGLGLEDAALQGVADKSFSPAVIEAMIQQLCQTGLDIIELGSVELSKEDKRGYAIYQSIEDASKTIPAQRRQGQLYSAMYRGPDTLVDDIPEWRPGMCDIARVILRYSELQKSLDFCGVLSQKGYKVFVQPMLTLRYTEEELQRVIDASNDMNAYALYFVDSYGYMKQEDVIRLFQRYDAALEPGIRIGFHAHNNMNLAFSNALTVLGLETERGIVLDSCMLGMGQGAGNLQTEIIADHMIGHYGAAYDYEAVLKACEMIEQYWVSNTWGYSLTYLLPALRRVAYKYATSFRHKYGLTYPEMDRIFQNIPEEYRHRYTNQSAAELLRRFGYDV